jgi:FkbM family methyltransferase
MGIAGSELVRRVARSVRHAPGLGSADWLWNWLRGPYHRVLNRAGRGVAVRVGGVADVRMPPEYIGGDWEKFEPESVAAFVGWLNEHPGALVLDIGCSIGIYSAIALFADPAARVIAFDSDLGSIQATQRMTQYATRQRLQCVHGFLTSTATHRVPLAEAVAATDKTLAAAPLAATRFICLGAPDTDAISCRRLDDLFVDGFDGRPCLVKCDVEGAEQLVLAGAETILRRFRPDLLLSVHPPELPQHGHTVDSIRAYLASLGYAIDCLAVDHEEHWLCRLA